MRIQTIILNRDFIIAYGITSASYTYYRRNSVLESIQCGLHEYNTYVNESNTLFEYNILLRVVPPCSEPSGWSISEVDKVEIVLYSGGYESIKIIIPYGDYGGHLVFNEYYIKIKIILTINEIGEEELFIMYYSFNDNYKNQFENRPNLYKTRNLVNKRHWNFENKVNNKNYSFSYSDNSNNQLRYRLLFLNKNDRIFYHNERENIEQEIVVGDQTYRYKFSLPFNLFGYTNSQLGVNKILSLSRLNSGSNLELSYIGSAPNFLIDRQYNFENFNLNVVVGSKIIHARDGADYVNYDYNLQNDNVRIVNPVITTSSFANVSPKMYFYREVDISPFGQPIPGQLTWAMDFLTPFIYYTVKKNGINSYSVDLHYISYTKLYDLEFDFNNALRYNVLDKTISTFVSTDINSRYNMMLLGIDYDKVLVQRPEGQNMVTHLLVFDQKNRSGFLVYDSIFKQSVILGFGGGYGVEAMLRLRGSFVLFPYILPWFKMLPRDTRYKAFMHK